MSKSRSASNRNDQWHSAPLVRTINKTFVNGNDGYWYHQASEGYSNHIHSLLKLFIIQADKLCLTDIVFGHYKHPILGLCVRLSGTDYEKWCTAIANIQGKPIEPTSTAAATTPRADLPVATLNSENVSRSADDDSSDSEETIEPVQPVQTQKRAPYRFFEWLTVTVNEPAWDETDEANVRAWNEKMSRKPPLTSIFDKPEEGRNKKRLRDDFDNDSTIEAIMPPSKQPFSEV